MARPNSKAQKVKRDIARATKIEKRRIANSRAFQSINIGTQARIGRKIVKKQDWRKAIDVSSEVGKKKYTEGQKNYIRALKVIENALDKPAADIKAVYGSDDIEELANQYYLPELGSYSKKELNEIESEFNKTHGYHVRLKNATNPFAGIDFNTLMPN